MERGLRGGGRRGDACAVAGRHQLSNFVRLNVEISVLDLSTGQLAVAGRPGLASPAYSVGTTTELNARRSWRMVTGRNAFYRTI
jgi:hypothetical protein